MNLILIDGGDIPCSMKINFHAEVLT